MADADAFRYCPYFGVLKPILTVKSHTKEGLKVFWSFNLVLFFI